MVTLERPLIAFDVETHAFVPPEESRIVEIGFHMIYPDGRPPKEWQSFVQPGVLITAEATEKHGITNAMVEHAPTFKALAPSLAKGFTACDYCGYNVYFDVRVFRAEMARAGQPWSLGEARLLDPFRLWRLAEPRTLSDAVRRFLNRDATRAHRAAEDAKDALDVALVQLDTFRQLPSDLQGLHDLCFEKEKDFVDPDGRFIWSNDEVVITFGKWGRMKTPLKKLPPSYLQWILRGDFSQEVKDLSLNALHGKFPVRETTTTPRWSGPPPEDVSPAVEAVTMDTPSLPQPPMMPQTDLLGDLY